MKVVCDCCRGSGEIPCPECDGSGGAYGKIEQIKLDNSMSNYKELIELQKDAKRVISQADRLTKINPSRSGSYDEQLRGTLFIINEQAERVAKKK